MADRRRDDDEDRGRRSSSRDDDRGSRRGDDDRGSERRGRDRDDRDDDRSSSRRSSRDDDDRGSKSGGSSYRYERRDGEKTRERASKGNNDFDRFLKDGVKVFKPNDGDNRIRILPPTWKGADHFGLDVYVHYGVGADRQTYLCRHKMLSEPDPIYEAYLEAKNEFLDDDKNEDLKKLVKDLEAKRRVLVWLVDRDHEKEGVQAWAMPWTIDRDIVQVMTDKSTGEVLPIDDPEEGYDVEFTKKGAKDRTEYTGVAISRRSSPLGKQAWMDHAVDNPLPDQLVYFEYDHIAKAFGGKSTTRGKDRDDRDRDDDRSGRRDRDDDRRGSSRDREEPAARRDRDDRDDDRGSSRREEKKGETWESIHDMTKSELVDLIDDEKLDINPRDAKSTEDLADWVCEEMKIKKEEKKDEGGGRRRSGDAPDEGEERMRKMRERRERD